METEKRDINDTRKQADSSLTWLVILHLLPGVLILLFYIFTARLAQKLGFPSFMALFVAIGVVLIPFELGYLFFQARKQNGNFSLKGIIRYTQPMSLWQYVIFGLILVMWSGIGFGVLADKIDPIIIKSLFGWIPDWFFILNPNNSLNGYAKSALFIAMMFNLVFNGLAGPVVEELYFRGYLLPRLAPLKGWAPLVNALLFSLYHFFTPWQNVIRIIVLVPMVYMIWWKRNIFLGMIVHCTGNLIGAILMITMIST